MTSDNINPRAEIITVRMIARTTNFTTDRHGILSQDNPLSIVICDALEMMMRDRFGADDALFAWVPKIVSKDPNILSYKEAGIKNEKEQRPLTLHIATRYPLEALEVLGDLIGRRRNAMVIGYIENIPSPRTPDASRIFDGRSYELPRQKWLAPLCDAIPLNGFKGMTFLESYGIFIPDQIHAEIVATRHRDYPLVSPTIHSTADYCHIVPGSIMAEALKPRRDANTRNLWLVHDVDNPNGDASRPVVLRDGQTTRREP